MIFVFGSNKAGIHGAGSAKLAYQKHGAKWRIGEGLVGNSYALPTKGYRIEKISLHEIQNSVNRFLETAEFWKDRHLQFKVTRVGCGLGGHRDADIAPMFINAPTNCYFDTKWEIWLDSDYHHFNYWGTF